MEFKKQVRRAPMDKPLLLKVGNKHLNVLYPISVHCFIESER